MKKTEISKVNTSLLSSYDIALKKVAKEYNKYLMLPEKERKLEIQQEKSKNLSGNIFYVGEILTSLGFIIGIPIAFFSAYDDKRWVYSLLPGVVTMISSPICQLIVQEKQNKLNDLRLKFEGSNGKQRVKLKELHSTIQALNQGKQSEGLNIVRTFLSKVNLEGNDTEFNIELLANLAYITKLFDQVNSGQTEKQDELIEEMEIFVNQLRHGTQKSKQTTPSFKDNRFLKEDIIDGFDDIMKNYGLSKATTKESTLKKALA